MLDILCIEGWNNKARIPFYTAWVCTVGKTSHIVVVSRHQVECMEGCIRPLARDQVAGRIVVSGEGGMADCSWWCRCNKSS